MSLYRTQMVANVWVYGSLAISRRFRIKLQVKFNKSTKVTHTTIPPMKYISCYVLVIIHYQVLIIILPPN